MVSLVVHMFAMGRASHLFWGLGGGGGGGGWQKQKKKKNKIMHKKRRRKHWYTRKHEKTFMQVSPLISGICTGKVRKEILIFLILFE